MTAPYSPREDLIAHRASTFEENTVSFAKKHLAIRDVVHLPRGFRSTWSDRTKLGIAKLADRIAINTNPAQSQGILLHAGGTTTDDDFIEVHVFGPMTRRTFERVVVRRAGRTPGKARIATLRARFAAVGVTVVETP